jgi:hypothetical protein
VTHATRALGSADRERSRRGAAVHHASAMAASTSAAHAAATMPRGMPGGGGASLDGGCGVGTAALGSTGWTSARNR